MQLHSPDDAQQLLVKGSTPEEVYAILLKEGWKLEEISAALAGPTQAVEGADHPHDLRQRTTTIILGLGVLMVAAGIFSSLAAGWGNLADSLKLGILLALVVLSHFLGWYVTKLVKPFVTLGRALHLLASFVFGAGLLLMNQAYSGLSWPDSFLIWSLGVLAVAVALDAREQYLLAVPLMCIGIVSNLLYLLTQFSQSEVTLSPLVLSVGVVTTVILGWQLRKRELATNPEVY